MRVSLRLGLGLAVSGACLWFAFHGTSWQALGAVLAGADLGWVAAGLAAVAASLAVRAWRWAWLLRPAARVTTAATLPATAIGFAASAVLPLRLGELVRPAVLARRTAIGIGPALSSVVVERLLDLMVVLLCFLALSTLHPFPPALRAAARTAAVGAGAGFAALLLAQWTRPTSELWVGQLVAGLPARTRARMMELTRGLLDGARAIADPGTALVVIALSGAVWGCSALAFVCALHALHLTVPVVAAALASVVIVAAFVALPQAPGFVGTWQAGCVVALGLFGVPAEGAAGYALLTWMLSMGVSVGLGGLFAAREGIGLRDVLRGRARASATAPSAEPPDPGRRPRA